MKSRGEGEGAISDRRVVSWAQYGSHAVVANLLHNRKDKVFLLQPESDPGANGHIQIHTEVIVRGDEAIIEKPLIDAISALHLTYVSRG